VPSFVAAEKPLTDWLKPIADKPGDFRSINVGHDKDVDLVPFYRLHRRTYSIYWDLFTGPEWKKHLETIATEKERQRKLEAASISFVQPGNMQAEKDANQQGESTTINRVAGRAGRRAAKWFSYDLAVDQNHPLKIFVTYHSEEAQKRTFEVLVDGQRIGEQTIERHRPGDASGKFFDVEYPIQADLLKGKQKVTVRFQPTGNSETASAFIVRIIRADAER